MSKIRDFIYNSSDIFLALIILVVAGFLIWTRIEVIMAYPDAHIAAQVEQDSNQTPVDNSGDTDQQDPYSVGTDDGDDTLGTEGEDAITPPTAPDNITIEIPADSTAEDVANILHQAGLIADPSEFLYAATEMQKYGSMKSGTFTINSNCTMEELVNMVAN